MPKTMLVLFCGSAICLHACAPVDSTGTVDASAPTGSGSGSKMPRPDARVPDPDANIASRKRVFVTRSKHQGDLATYGGNTSGERGLEGADRFCNDSAHGQFGTPDLGGTWTAFVSASSFNGLPPVDAKDRVPNVGPWYLVDQTTEVFASKAAVTGTPLHAIDQDEAGETPATGDDTNNFVWTGSQDGATNLGLACGAWYTNADFVGGAVGLNNTVAYWLQAGLSPMATCNTLARLYCFEN